METLEKFDVFGYHLVRKARLETDSPLAHTGTLKFEDLFCFRMSILLFVVVLFNKKKVFSVSKTESVLRVAHFHPASYAKCPVLKKLFQDKTQCN